MLVDCLSFIVIDSEGYLHRSYSMRIQKWMDASGIAPVQDQTKNYLLLILNLYHLTVPIANYNDVVRNMSAKKYLPRQHIWRKQ